MWVIYILIIVLSAYLGFFVYQRLKNKRDYFKSLLDFLDRFNQNVAFVQSSFPEFILNFSSISADFKLTLNSILKHGFENNSEVFFPDYITKEEKSLIINIICSIGVLNQEMEQDHIRKSRYEVDELYKKSKEQFEKYGALSIKLGFILGILLVILLI